MDEVYRGWAGRRGVGWVGSQRRAIPSTRRQTAVLCLQYGTEAATVNLVRPDGCQQQFDSPSSLISAHQWPHRLCSGPSWFYRVGKRPPMKADLAIYSLRVGMYRQWENVAAMLNIKLDFCCCDNSVDFCKSSHRLL